MTLSTCHENKGDPDMISICGMRQSLCTGNKLTLWDINFYFSNITRWQDNWVDIDVLYFIWYFCTLALSSVVAARGSDEIYIGRPYLQIIFILQRQHNFSFNGNGMHSSSLGNNQRRDNWRFSHLVLSWDNIFIGIRSSFPTNRRDANGIKMLMQSIATGRIVVKATLLFLQALSFVSI